MTRYHRPMSPWLSITCRCLAILPMAAAVCGAQLQRYDVRDGLPQNSATALTRDHFGLLWVGTEDGLARFDGSRFVPFEAAADRGLIPGNYVIALTSDEDAVWIAAESGGIARFDLMQEQFQIVDVRDPIDHKPLNAWTLLTHGDSLWVGTRDKGLLQLDRTDPTRVLGHWHRDAAPPRRLLTNSVRDLSLDPDGDSIWVAGVGALSRVTLADGSVRQDTLEGIEQSGREIDCAAVAVDAERQFWLATRSHGLFRRARDATHFEPIPVAASITRIRGDVASMNDMALAAHAGVVVASDRGLLEYRRECNCLDAPDGAAAFRDTIASALFLSVLGDGDFVWGGSWNRGLFRIDAKAPSFDLLTPFQLGSETAPAQPRSLFVDARDQLWVGTFGAGLRVAAIESRPMAHWSWQSFDEGIDPPARQIWAFAERRNGDLFIGSDEGIRRWRDEGASVTHLDLDPRRADQLRALMLSSNDQLWAGGVGGVHRIDPDHLTAHYFGREQGLNDLRVYALAEWPRGQLLVGTWSGLYRMPLDGKLLQPWHLRRDHQDYATRLIWDLHIDDDGDLWIGTSSGLLHMAAGSGGDVTRFAEAEGLPNAVIYTIEAGEAEDLWLSSNRGLVRFNRRSHAVVAYDARDGLQGDEFGFGMSARDASGRLYFAGLNGVSQLDPVQMPLDARTPTALLGELQVNNHPLAVGEARHGRVVLTDSLHATDHVTLSHRDADIGLTFSALGPDRGERQRFQYRLEGKDPDWVEAGSRRFVGYTNLQPETYRFRLRAANRFAQFGPERVLTIDITPPIWATWPFRIAVLALMIGSVLLAVRWRFASLTRSRAELAAEVARQTERIREQNEQLEAANEALFDRSIRDPLTGAFNRRHFAELADQAYVGCRNRTEPFALVLIDVDHFKLVNDRHGHAAGDAVLSALVQGLKPLLKGQEALGRYGGEEFVVMLPGHDLAAARARAEAMRFCLQQLAVQSGDATLRITASFGVASADVGHHPPLESLLGEADAALYRAKALGRDRIETAGRITR